MTEHRETAASRAEQWLKDHLTAAGRPVPSDAIKAAATEAGHRLRTLHRVRGRIGVLITPIAGTPRTQWSLGTHGTHGTHVAAEDGMGGTEPACTTCGDTLRTNRSIRLGACIRCRRRGLDHVA